MLFHTGGLNPYLILQAKLVSYLFNFVMEYMTSNDTKNTEKLLLKL